MDFIFTSFLSLPNILLYVILGTIAGAIGSVIGSIVSKIFKKEILSGIVTIAFVVIALQQTNHILPQMRKAAALEQVMQELKGQRLFSVLSKLHPEVEEEFKLKMTDIINNSTYDQVFYKSQAASVEIVEKYLNKHMLSASDEMTYKQIQLQAKGIARFQNKPELCVSYFLGNPQFSEDDITPEFLNESSNLKADIIESSVINPSAPPEAANVDEIIEIIAESYQKNGFDLQGLNKIDHVATLLPSEGCKIAMDFSKAIAAMEQKQATYVFKNLLYISNQQQ